MTSRSKLAEIFNPTSMDNFSSDNVFGQAILPLPLIEGAGEEVMSPDITKDDLLNAGKSDENLFLKA